MPTFIVETRGTDGAARQLEGMGERATQLRPIFDNLIGALIEGENTLWDRNSYTLRDWAPTTKRNFARKVAHGYDPRVMRRTGYTHRALTQRGAPGQIAHGGGTILTFGVKGVAANVAQFSKNPKRHREVVKVLPKVRTQVRQIVLDHLLEGLE